MRYAFIDAEKATETNPGHSVALMCRVLSVSRSGYYAYLAARPVAEEQARQEDELVAEIRHIHDASRRAYGAPITRLQAEHGIAVTARTRGLTQLVVSELVTNALKYAPGPAVLDLRVTGAVVEVAVWDSDPVLPVARAADAGRVGQHGLEIVMAVDQGLEAQREPVGKRITARLALLDDPDGAVADRLPV
ncbi:ATP-binding protein [Streptomyces sp. NPDC004008]